MHFAFIQLGSAMKSPLLLLVYDNSCCELSNSKAGAKYCQHIQVKDEERVTVVRKSTKKALGVVQYLFWKQDDSKALLQLVKNMGRRNEAFGNNSPWVLYFWFLFLLSLLSSSHQKHVRDVLWGALNGALKKKILLLLKTWQEFLSCGALSIRGELCAWATRQRAIYIQHVEVSKELMCSSFWAFL